MNNESLLLRGKGMNRIEPKVILCPTDFSDPATFALRYAQFMAEGFQARLVVLYAEAFEPPPYFTANQEKALLKSLARSRRAAEAHLSRYVRAHTGETLQAESLVVEGYPATAILQTAGERDIDWIVIGTHGHSGWQRLMMGSVTEKVLGESERPVLAVRYKKRKEETSPVSLRQVICPVNYTEIALQALHQAVAIVECFSARLLVFHVLESSGDESEEREMDRLCTWIPEEVRSRCEMKEMIRKGNAGEQILEVAASTDCDMIVLGAQHKRFHDSTVIGTTTMNVTRRAPCPVLTVISRRT
jgi:nucleotide-binding universal stress UspA family protein